jgi:competence protein ComEA
MSIMGTPGEKKALLFLAGVMLLGGGVRAANAIASDRSPAQHDALDRQIEEVDSARNKGKKPKKSKKPAVIAPAIVDLDIASADQIETLRYVGPKLAQRIVADRDSLGPFGSLDELQRVKGVGPKLAAKLDSSVTFSLLPRPSRTETSEASATPKGRRKSRRGDSTQ